MNAKKLGEALEILGQISEEVTLMQSHAADLDDEQLSVAVARIRTWTITAGNRVAVLRREENAVAA